MVKNTVLVTGSRIIYKHNPITSYPQIVSSSNCERFVPKIIALFTLQCMEFYSLLCVTSSLCVHTKVLLVHTKPSTSYMIIIKVASSLLGLCPCWKSAVVPPVCPKASGLTPLVTFVAPSQSRRDLHGLCPTLPTIFLYFLATVLLSHDVPSTGSQFPSLTTSGEPGDTPQTPAAPGIFPDFLPS